MPLVDGYSATKMIRSFEKTHAGACLSDRAKCNHRIPIFAVSASLVERDRNKYMDIGFDGWILKPVDFKRVNEMLKGIVDDGTRDGCIYQPGRWEQGGWFAKRERQPDAFDVATKPSEKSPTDHDTAAVDGQVDGLVDRHLEAVADGVQNSDNDVSPAGSVTPKAVPADGS